MALIGKLIRKELTIAEIIGIILWLMCLLV